MLFFDYDGVLVDSLGLWEEACKYAAITMNFKGDFPVKPYAKLNPLAHKEIGKQLGLDSLVFERIADAYFLKHISCLKLFANTQEMLEQLYVKYDLCVMSASSEDIVSNSLSRFGILQYFKNLYCGSDIPKSTKLNQYKKSNSIMIGDSISDMQAAKTAHVYGIGVLWGWQEKEMLQDANILVKNHTELLKAIKDFYENHSNN